MFNVCDYIDCLLILMGKVKHAEGINMYLFSLMWNAMLLGIEKELFVRKNERGLCRLSVKLICGCAQIFLFFSYFSKTIVFMVACIFSSA